MSRSSRARRLARALVVLAAPLALAACSGDSTNTGDAATSGGGGGGAGGASAGPPEVRFALGTTPPRFLDVPWPSDVYLEGDGTLVDVIPGLDAYVTQFSDKLTPTFASQRGFGVNEGGVFRITSAGVADALAPGPLVDADSLPADEAESLADEASVMLVDLDAMTAAGARIPARVAFHDDSATGSTLPALLSVMPARGVVLAPGHRHAAVVTTRVTAGGKAVRASAGFDAVRSGGSADAALYADALDRLGVLVPSLDASKVAGLAVFTTMDAAGELAEMREQVLALPPPALSWASADLAPMGQGLFADHAVAGFTATFADWLGQPDTLPDGSHDPARDQSAGAAYDALAAMGTAVFDAPNFLQVKADGYADPDHANVARDAGGHPVIDPHDPTAKIWVTVALPKGPVPVDGFPVVILQHGLGGDRSFILSLANTFARAGWATVAIDAPTFGTRATNPADAVDELANFPWSAGAPYAGPDGFVDKNASPVSFFGAFTNFGAVRDQLREAVVDIGTLADVVTDPSIDLGPLLDAVPGAKLDAGRLGYVGDSFGSIVGLMVASVDPKIRHFVLNVGGGGVLTEVVANSPNLAQLLNVGALLYGFTAGRNDESHVLVQLIQSLIDPADPLTHARFLATTPRSVGGTPNPDRSVVLIEAVWDEVVANHGTEAMARAAGMPLASPSVGSIAGLTFASAAPDASGIHDVPRAGVTTVLVQASPATHGADLYNAHGSRNFSPPFARPGLDPFPGISPPFDVREPYLGLQKMAVSFFTSAFAGAGAPVVKDFPTPLRDFDDDGKDDATDPAPQDPSK